MLQLLFVVSRFGVTFVKVPDATSEQPHPAFVALST
jgi:hypothetical protein